jgi:hypothetical protein
MGSFKHQERIHAPAEEAFEFGLDPDNWLRHFGGLDEYELIEETQTKKHLRLSYRLLWIPMEFDMILRVVEPNKHLAVDYDSKWMSGEANYYYSEIEEGTLLESRGTYEFGDSMIVKLLAPVIRLALHRQIPKAAREEKRLIEAEAAEK